jgi:membrane fusion protein, multidrug efflux system
LLKNKKENMMKIKNIVLSTVLSLFILGCGESPAEMMKKKMNEPVSVEVENPIKRTVMSKEEFNGVVEPVQIIQIKNRIDGFIEKQYFKDGQYVKNGQLLYKIDSRILNAELENLNAQLTIAKVNLENLTSIHNKIDNSYKIGGSSLQEKEISMANINKEKANIQLINANIKKSKLNLSFTNIYSPVNGKIEKSQFNSGSYVTAGGVTLTNIYETDKLHFTVELPSDKEEIKSGFVNLKNTKMVADLDYCDPAANISSGMIKCRYLFNSINYNIPINLIGKIYFNQEQKEGLYIKQSALIQNKSDKSVYINKNNIAVMKNVKTNTWTEDGYVEVLEGIKIEDEVIVNGVANLKKDSKIKIDDNTIKAK